MNKAEEYLSHSHTGSTCKQRRQQHDQVLDRRKTGGGRRNWELKCVFVRVFMHVCVGVCVWGGYAKCGVCLGDGFTDYGENWE